MSTCSAVLARDWAVPRAAAGFTGYVGNPRDGQWGPSGTLALCVTNTQIPCTLEGMDSQKFIQLTVLNIRKKGWIYAPWKKPVGKNAKVVRDDNAKELFENGEWARNDITMERVGQSVTMYSFVKDGQARGERLEESTSKIASGQTFRVRLQPFMFEDKKDKNGDGRNVFPTDVEFIPPFTVVEIMFTPANQGGFEQGYGLQIARVRPCEFSLYSMLNPLGLGLLPSTYEDSVRQAEGHLQSNPGLGKVLEDKNTGFFGKVTKGAYLIKYNEDYRLVGPKETPDDPQSRHLDAMQGGVFAVDILKEDLLRFTNAREEEEEDGLVYAQCLVDLAAAAGALECYVTYNEYLLRQDPNRSPFTGAPLIDSNKLLECVDVEQLMTGPYGLVRKFQLPFEVPNMDKPFIGSVGIAVCTLENLATGPPPLPCPDFALASENTPVAKGYTLSLGDAVDEEFMRILFVPKTMGGGKAPLDRQDYRLLKKQKTV